MLLYNQTICRLIFFFVAAFILGATINTAFVLAGDKSLSTGDARKDEMIYITSDKLISDSEASWTEFIGNVRVVQETTVITANRIKIYYHKDLDDKKNISASEESISKIVAKGNVKIESDNRTVETEHAVYTAATRIFVLTGTNSKIIDGNSTISGSKITLFRDDGRIQVDSGSQNRVEALIYPGKRGIK